MSQTLEQTTEVTADEPLYEVIDGQRRELEPMGAFQTLVASALCWLLGEFARETKSGVVVNEMLFLLDSESRLQRRPDVAFVSYARWPEKTIESSAAWNVVPDLAVEVISPTNTADEIDRKLTDYFNSGVRLVWIIHPETAHVYAYDSPRGCRRLERSETLTGGDVLPGFELEIETLLAAATRPD